MAFSRARYVQQPLCAVEHSEKKKELIYMHITVLFLKEEIMLHIISRMHKCIKMKKCGLTPFTFKEKN